MFRRLICLGCFVLVLGVELGEEQAIDSRNIMDALLGKDSEGLPYTIEEGRGGPGLRRGPWKYMLGQATNREALYNLEADIGERNNLLKEHPARAQAMKTTLQQLMDAEEGVRKSD